VTEAMSLIGTMIISSVCTAATLSNLGIQAVAAEHGPRLGGLAD